MPLYSSFSPYGQLGYSSRKPVAQVIYEAMRDGMGDTFASDDLSGYEQARLYALAVQLAGVQAQNERVKNNINPATAYELLPSHEQDYQVIPGPNDTIPQRRATLAARVTLSRGARRESVEAALTKLLGSAFVSYQTISNNTQVSWPSSPGTVGVFAAPGAKIKLFKISEAVSTINTPITVHYTALNGTDKPLAGEAFAIDPDPRRALERVVIASATATTLTAAFTKAHEAGTLGVAPHPMWLSSQRYALIKVTLAAATDPETRRKINELMARKARGVSQWAIVHNQGVLTTDDPVLGLMDCTPMS